jgi:holliday junction DNA helicase RuvA
MISSVRGRLVKITQHNILLDIAGICYEIFIPLTVFNELKETPCGREVSLVTFYYHINEPSKSLPVLIGFANEIEREFFEKFITVSGVGPKAAVRAINKPISDIARAIDRADIVFLKSLPGIGEQRAREIIAKLQGKIGKFALIQDSFEAAEAVSGKSDMQEEAVQILVQLQYKKDNAKDMVKKAIQRNPKISTIEELLNEVYKQRA